MMRFVLPLLLLTACGSPQRQTVADRPIGDVQNDRILCVTDAMLATGGSDTVRFGRLRSGEIAVVPLWIGNATDRPIVPADYATSCGCTSLEFDTQPIRPGEARRMTVTFDARGEWGWQFRTVDLQLAGAGHPLRLFVEADVE